MLNPNKTLNGIKLLEQIKKAFPEGNAFFDFDLVLIIYWLDLR